MKFHAISGSARSVSTNTAMLRSLQAAAEPEHEVTLSDHVGRLAIFSPHLEYSCLPAPVAEFAEAMAKADGLIVASPEYVRSIAGGLKNAIDWFVSRFEIVGKPIVARAASHRATTCWTSAGPCWGP